MFIFLFCDEMKTRNSIVIAKGLIVIMITFAFIMPSSAIVTIQEIEDINCSNDLDILPQDSLKDIINEKREINERQRTDVLVQNHIIRTDLFKNDNLEGNADFVPGHILIKLKRGIDTQSKMMTKLTSTLEGDARFVNVNTIEPIFNIGTKNVEKKRNLLCVVLFFRFFFSRFFSFFIRISLCGAFSVDYLGPEFLNRNINL